MSSTLRNRPYLAERGARLAAAILDSIIFAGMVYLPLMFAVIGGDEAGVISS